MELIDLPEGRVRAAVTVLPAIQREVVLKNDLFLETIICAKAGAHWLDREAPKDWPRKMTSAKGGRITSHVCMSDKVLRHPLVLAFATDCHTPRLEDVFEQYFSGQRTHEAALLGFFCKDKEVSGVLIPAGVWEVLLTAAWEYVLGNFDPPVAVRAKAHA